jgi:hypothetical protein
MPRVMNISDWFVEVKFSVPAFPIISSSFYHTIPLASIPQSPSSPTSNYTSCINSQDHNFYYEKYQIPFVNY